MRPPALAHRIGCRRPLSRPRPNQQRLEKRKDGWYASAQKTCSRKGKLGKLLKRKWKRPGEKNAI